jgi:tRNA-2-methylthio-N6-dimethylallyladenosine synthase
METVQFDSAFTFKYSPRPHTKAEQYSEQILDEKKQERLQKVIDLQKQHTLLQNQRFIGNMEMVLVERESKRDAGFWAGRTDSNKWVIFEKGGTQIKDIVPVLITDAKGISLHGHLVKIKEAA